MIFKFIKHKIFYYMFGNNKTIKFIFILFRRNINIIKN